MKKRLAILLAALLALSALPALAAPVSLTFFGEMLETGIYIGDIAGGGQDLYSLVNSGSTQSLYHWQVGMEAPELWVADVASGGMYLSLTDAKKYGGEKDYAHAMDKLFMYEGSLAALNTFDGTVFTIEKKDGQIVYEPLVALEWEGYLALQESSYSILGLEAMDGKLYFATRYWGNEGSKVQLDEFDVKTGKSRRVEAQFVTALTPYKDGQLIVSVYDQDHAYNRETDQMTYPTLQILNPADGKLQKFYDCDESYGGGLRYDAAADSLYFLTNGGIQLMKGLAAPIPCAYAAVDGWGEAASALLDGGLYALVSNQLLAVISTDPSELSDVVLNVTGINSKSSYAFSKDHPNVPLLNAGWYTDVNELLGVGAAKSAGTDILQVSGDELARVIDKGYALDLSGNAQLMARIEKMHPAIQKACMRDGKLYAFPSQAYAPAYGFDSYVFKDLPVIPEDVPANWIDLCAFINDWNEKKNDEAYGVKVMDGSKSNLFYSMLSAYQDYYAYTGDALTFDTPLFRQLMAAYESLQMPDDSMTDEDFWNMPSMLIDYGNPLSGNTKRLPLSLTADTPYIATVQGQFYFVNPNSKNPELATELLTYVPLDYDEETRIIFYPGIEKPMKSPDFEKRMEEYRDQLEASKKQLETAEPADRQGIEDNIKWLEDMLQHPERFEYTIALDVFEQYRELVTDNLVISSQGVLNSTGDSSEELYSLNSRYLQGQIKLDEYIQKLEKITRMVLKEQR